jgi:hypothetical protein
LDRVTCKIYRTGLGNVATQRELYTLDVAKGDPYLFEKALAKFEGESATALREILQTHRIPRGEAFEILMNFVALTYARVPSRRPVLEEPMERMLKLAMAIYVETPERYQSLVDAYNKAHPDESIKGSDYEEQRRFVQQDNFRIRFSQNWHLENLNIEMSQVIPMLARRRWSLLVADKDAGSFICSDNPVVLTWTKPIRGPWRSPGFGMRDTVVAFPLSRQVALIGLTEGSQGTARASARSVARVNSLLISFADRYLYCTYGDISWLDTAGAIHGTKELRQAIRQTRLQRKLEG